MKPVVRLPCSVLSGDAVVPAIDVDTIYQAQSIIITAALIQNCCVFLVCPAMMSDLSRWEKIVHGIRHPEGGVKVAIVGKYTELKEAYKTAGGPAWWHCQSCHVH